MSSDTSPTNVQNLPGYLGYVDRTFNQGTLLPGMGDLKSFPIDLFLNAINIAGTRQVNGGEANWLFGLLDVATAIQPALQYDVDQFYLISDLRNSGFQLTTPFPPQFYEKYNLQNGSTGIYSLRNSTLGMDLGELYQFFQDFPYNPVDWNTEAFWTNNPEATKFRDFYAYIYAAGAGTNGVPYPPRTNPTDPLDFSLNYYSNIPTSFADIYTLITKLTIVPQGTPALVKTARPPDFVNPQMTPETLLQTVFASYVQSYPENISTYLAGTGITDPYSIDAFAAGWYNFLQTKYKGPESTPTQIPIQLTDPNNSFLIPTGTYVDTPSLNTGITLVGNGAAPMTLQQFVADFKSKMLADFSTQFNTAQDWDDLTLKDANGQTITIDDESLLQKNFHTFMNYIIDQGGSAGITSYDSFKTQWDGFIGPVSLLSNDTSVPNSQSVLTYQSIYNVFYPEGTPEHGKFLENLSKFVSHFLSTGDGTFNPSLMIDQWLTNLVKNIYGKEFVEEGRTSLSDANFESVRILRLVYKGLASMIQSIQNLAVSQANRLSFYSDLQKAYTKVLEEVPVVVSGVAQESGSINTPTRTGGANPIIYNSPINSTSLEDIQRRADFNALSAKYMESIRSYRSLVADMGTAVQAAVSQSNQAVNAETTVATQILKTVNTIAKSIHQK